MNSTFTNLVSDVANADSAEGLLLAAIVVAVASMAFIQMLKEFFGLRYLFNYISVRIWLDKGMALSSGNHEVGWVGRLLLWLRRIYRWSSETKRAEDELIKLATAGDRGALYNLPIEQLCGQVSAAAQAAVGHPSEYRAFIMAVGGSAGEEDLSLLTEKGDGDSRADARHRVSQQMQRAIDALQISASLAWRRSIQLGALVLSFLLTAWLLGVQATAPDPVRLLVIAIVGAFLAPVVRDLFAVLQALRTRR